MLKLGILIFLARLADVSLGTLKFKELVRGNKLKASIIAFAEVLIYTLAASQAFKYISNVYVLMFFATGYACGSYLGMLIDEKLDKGSVLVLIVTEKDDWALADALREQGFGVTTAKGYGLGGAEKVQLKVFVERNRLSKLNDTVKRLDSSAYIVTMDVKDIRSMSSMKK